MPKKLKDFIDPSRKLSGEDLRFAVYDTNSPRKKYGTTLNDMLNGNPSSILEQIVINNTGIKNILEVRDLIMANGSKLGVIDLLSSFDHTWVAKPNIVNYEHFH